MGVYVVRGMETESISEVLCLWNPAAILPQKTLKKEYKRWTPAITDDVTRSKKLFWGTVSFPSLSVHCTPGICELKRHFSDVNGRAALKPLDMLDRR